MAEVLQITGQEADGRFARFGLIGWWDQQRLAQAKRIADMALDPLTKERLQRLVQELEEQLRLSRARD